MALGLGVRRRADSGGIAYFQGERGLAILLVVLFHAYARWPTLYPYGDAYSDVPLVRFGDLGVAVFFMISGYFVRPSLARYGGIAAFLARRWLRLFPAMLAGSLLVYLSAPGFPERPAGAPELLSLLPGLTGVEPSWWSGVLQHRIPPLEVAFWALYVEVKFYVFAACVYYGAGRKALLPALGGVFLVAAISKAMERYGGGLPIPGVALILKTLSFEYFGWFAAGVALNCFQETHRRRWLGLGVGFAVLSAATFSGLQGPRFLAACLVALVFVAAPLAPWLQNALRNRVLCFFGFISYPLYLIHENLMVASIVKLAPLEAVCPPYLIPLIPIAVLTALAYGLAAVVEPALRAGIVAVWPGLSPAPMNGTMNGDSPSGRPPC